MAMNVTKITRVLFLMDQAMMLESMIITTLRLTPPLPLFGKEGEGRS
jgi:hypothetical protein